MTVTAETKIHKIEYVSGYYVAYQKIHGQWVHLASLEMSDMISLVSCLNETVQKESKEEK